MEYLQNDIVLDNEFFSIFYPFYMVNSVLLVRKYNVREYNLIENVNRNNMVCAVFISCFMFCFYYIVMNHTHFGVLIYKAGYFFVYFSYAFVFASVSVINLYHTDISVRLLYILNENNKYLHSRKYVRKLKFITWVSVALVTTNCTTLILFKLIYDIHWSFMRGFYVAMSALLDVELIQVSVFILLLTYQTRVWNKKVENWKPVIVNDENIVVDNETILEEIYFNFKCINEAWNLIKKSAELFILFHYVTTFIQSIFYAEILIVWSIKSFGKLEYIISHAVGMLLLLTKAFFVETGLCVASETFYEEIDRVHTNVILKLAQDLPSKKVWKNIYRILDQEFDKLHALNMFVVDAATLLHYCNLVTTYIIVLLQFAFLH